MQVYRLQSRNLPPDTALTLAWKNPESENLGEHDTLG